MYGQTQHGLERDDIAKARQEAGKYVKALREAAGLSQRELAKLVGIEYYTFISQIESGRGRVPPLQMKGMAKAFNVSERDFATTLMKYYDPISYDMIFGEKPDAELQGSNGGKLDAVQDAMEARLQRLERLLAEK